MKCSVSDLWSPQLQHSLIGIRVGKLRQPRSIFAENRVPLRQSQPVWFRPRMHSTGQATWLPPSFPRSCVCVSFSVSISLSLYSHRGSLYDPAKIFPPSVRSQQLLAVFVPSGVRGGFIERLQGRLLGQSDSAPAGVPSIHWMLEHRFPSDH